MTGPMDPHYPGSEPYQAAGPPYPPRSGGFWQRLAPRTAARPLPRLGLSLAGAGVALAVYGVIVWSGTYLGQGGSGGGGTGSHDSRRWLGIVLSLLVVAAGYLLAIVSRRGALATAGVVSSALGVPVLMVFLTLDTSGGQLISVDAVVWVSLVVWVGSYLFVRGAQGHAFYLALAALTLWVYFLDKVEPNLFALPGAAVSATFASEQSGLSFVPPDLTSIAGASLTIGLIYYLVALGLDHAGRSGAAVSFVLAGFPAVVVGIAALANDLHQTGSGVLLIVISLLLGAYGGHYGRRFTTWIWAAGVVLGVLLILTKIIKDSTLGGIVSIIVGAVLVVLGALVTPLLREPPDVIEPAGVGTPPGGY